MDARASEDAAFTMLHEASVGKDISNRYNSLTLPEQQQVLSSMRAVQSGMMAQFGNIELYDNDKDGILDDARARVVDKNSNVLSRDVYNPVGARPQAQGEAGHAEKSQQSNGKPNDDGAGKNNTRAGESETSPRLPSQSDINRDPFLRQADNMLRTASRGGDIYRQFSRLDPQSAAEMTHAMQVVQMSKSDVYGNVELVDSDKNGILDDVRVHGANNRGPATFDAFKTPSDQQAARVERNTVDGAARAGQIILEEGLRGIGRDGRGPSTGDRIQRRMGQEAVRNSNRILRDILGGGR
jgi:hypothetical protein